MTKTTNSKAFGGLTDPKINRRLRHPLVNILTILSAQLFVVVMIFVPLKNTENLKQTGLKVF